MEQENVPFSGEVAVLGKEIVQLKTEKFIGKWKYVNGSGAESGNWSKYFEQFGFGFFRSMTINGGIG